MNLDFKIIFGLMFLVFILTAGVWTDKEIYQVNEIVTIYTAVQNLSNPSIKLTAPEKSYNYLNPPEKIRYLPPSPGTYTTLRN